MFLGELLRVPLPARPPGKRRSSRSSRLSASAADEATPFDSFPRPLTDTFISTDVANVNELAVEACRPHANTPFLPFSHEFARHTTQHDHRDNTYIHATHFSCTIYTSARFSLSNHVSWGTCVLSRIFIALSAYIFKQVRFISFLPPHNPTVLSILFQIPKVQLTDEGTSDTSLNSNV